jgi:hypothetical protein
MAVVTVCAVAAYGQTPKVSLGQDKQKLAELTADRIMDRFYETLHFKTIWDEFYVKDQKLRDLEVEAMTYSLVRYRADELSDMRISMAARQRAYIANIDFLLTLSAAAFTSGNVPSDSEYAKRYESISQRPKPWENTDELDREFTSVMNQLSDADRKLIIPGNVGSTAYNERISKIHETRPADVDRIREVFAVAGLKQTSPIYVVQREMHHIYMIEENGELRIITILSRNRG